MSHELCLLLHLTLSTSEPTRRNKRRSGFIISQPPPPPSRNKTQSYITQISPKWQQPPPPPVSPPLYFQRLHLFQYLFWPPGELPAYSKKLKAVKYCMFLSPNVYKTPEPRHHQLPRCQPQPFIGSEWSPGYETFVRCSQTVA